MNIHDNTHNNIQEIRLLIKKQQLLEDEMGQLKKSLQLVEHTNKEAINVVHNRIDSIEKELVHLSASIDNIVSSVSRVQETVNRVYHSVDNIEGKQDRTIEIQDKFISQLWKAFFAILTVITAGAALIFNLIQ